ncbi:hypothetical protein O1611_g6429 [Lasiodiplodia mahajangana]|uniref:Uncharacterized protein n=1 Tax=Lasiodiplodia mahajangana TaxID=1108764 RepID=A0ACC2JJ47_9PEZI|nr:hypothetical protein O1611_g6429 [Lasiodiplodia mahajangana]
MEKQKLKKEEKKREREKDFIAPEEPADGERKKKKRKTKTQDDERSKLHQFGEGDPGPDSRRAGIVDDWSGCILGVYHDHVDKGAN